MTDDPSNRPAPPSGLTAWHPPLIALLTERGPRWTTIHGELRIAAELRVDGVIEVRADVVRNPNDSGDVLRGMWSRLAWVGLLEFKSVSRPLRRGDLARLLGYGCVWYASHQTPDALRVAADKTRRVMATDLTLFLVVAMVTPTLREEAAELGLTFARDDSGYHELRGGPFRMLVVDLATAGTREHDELMQWFAGVATSCSLATRRWIRQHTGGKGAMNATPDLEGWDDWMEQWVATLSTERKLRLLTPEERLAGLKPEDLAHALKPEDVVRAFKPEDIAHALKPEDVVRAFKPEDIAHALKPEDRLVDLAPAQVVLALPLELLRVLPESYLATLPDDVQATVRGRLRG